MNKVFILLDRSYSMQSMWEEAISGINSYVKKLENVDVMLAAFDTESYDVVRNCASRNWEPLTTREIEPRGSTPLLDAAGRIMWSMLDSKAERAMLVIVTDGEENSSKNFKIHDVKNLTNQITNKNYEIVFLGANFDKIGEVAQQNFGWNDNTRIMQTSVKGFGSAMAASATGTMQYLNSGIRVGAFYNANDKADALKK